MANIAAGEIILNRSLPLAPRRQRARTIPRNYQLHFDAKLVLGEAMLSARYERRTAREDGERENNSLIDPVSLFFCSALHIAVAAARTATGWRPETSCG